MCDWLDLFWKWSGTTPEKYSTEGMNQNKGEFEDDFPFFQELISYAIEAINNNVLDEVSVDEIITIMALDNECECILEYIVDNSSDEQIKRIIEYGMVHSQYNARWQIAELIFRRKPIDFGRYLSKLSLDNHPYVRRRALNLINRQKPEIRMPGDGMPPLKK